MGPLDHWAATQQSMTALGRDLTDEQAELAVPACPEWTVRQVFAHQAGVAADILGGRLEGVTTDPWTDRQVTERAEHSLTRILDEWDADAPRLLEAMAPLGDAVDSRMVIDIWTHEQDVRGAVGRAGNRSGPVMDWILVAAGNHLERQFDRSGLPPLVVETGAGPTPVGGASLSVDAFELARALTGRRSLDQMRAWAWTVEDPEPYLSLIPAFSARTTDLIEPA